jgi:hypothetical protein
MTEKRRSTTLPWAETSKTSSGEMPPNQFTADEYFRVPVPRSAILERGWQLGSRGPAGPAD